MTCRLLEGHRAWGGGIDDEGYRTYVVVHRIQCDKTDGPANVLQTTGLPVSGQQWSFFDDDDQWVFCLPGKQLTMVASKDGEPNTFWDVESRFTNKPPPGNQSRCQDDRIEDPLLEPAKVSGSWVKRSEEATHDRFGMPIQNSAFEQLSGPKNEWDQNLDTVKIEQNIATPYQGYILPSMFKDCLNDRPLWGLPRRCIKLSSSPWERVFYGQCSIYYKRTLEFELNPNTFDRNIRDEGHKVLRGHWDNSTGNWVLDRIAGEYPNRWNPADFIQYKDRNGGDTRVILNGAGLPAGVRVVGHTAVEFVSPDTTTSSQATREAATLAAGAAQAVGILVFNVVDFNSRTGLGGPLYTAANAAALFGLSYQNAASTAAAGVARADAAALALTARNAGFIFRAAVDAMMEPMSDLLSSGSYSGFQTAIDNLALMVGRALSNAEAAYAASFDAYVEVVRLSSTVSTGTGTTTTSDVTVPGFRHVEKYNEVNLLLLGIPTSF